MDCSVDAAVCGVRITFSSSYSGLSSGSGSFSVTSRPAMMIGMPESTEKGIVMKGFGNNSDELKQNLVKGSITIADLEFEYDMEHDENDT